MCGIAGIVYSSECTDSFDWSQLFSSTERLQSWPPNPLQPPNTEIESIENAIIGLREYGPSAALWNDTAKRQALAEAADILSKFESKTQQMATAASPPLSTMLIESWNALWVRVRDIRWTIENEVLASLERVKALLPESLQSQPNLNAWKITTVLDNIGRLEVRGRDSLGISIAISYPSREICAEAEAALERTAPQEWRERISWRDLRSHTIRRGIETDQPTLLFVYKTAKEIGALGDNVCELCRQIREDRLLWQALSDPQAKTSVWSHTRWASNGIISEANCHPVDELSALTATEQADGYWIAAAANGDVDNVRELAQLLQRQTGQTIAKNITCDTKIIPMLVNWHYQQSGDLLQAFSQTVSECEGSAAVVMQSSLDPEHLYLSLKGSGQSLFIGLCTHGYTFASELYGIVEQTSSFIRLEGTKEAVAGRPETAG
ncbi:hypothetical protein IJT17_04740, partial [bacterium]|nr:hypothetical protein [bacterium]